MKLIRGHPRWKWGLALLLTALILLPQAVMASDIIDFTEKGSITVAITSRNTGLAAGGGSLSLYKVADVIEDKSIGYVFDTSGTEFDAAKEDLSSDEKLDAALAARLAGFAQRKEIPGTTLPVSEQGIAKAEALSLGLYLVVQKEAADGYSSIEPFLVSVPQRNPDGTYIYQVDATPKPGTQVRPEPTRKPTVTPTHGPRLPQTGQVWWPVFILAGAGIACLLIGMAVRK